MRIKYKKYTIGYQEFLGRYEWTTQGTLTPPFIMSNLGMHNAIQRLFKKIGKSYPEFRMFCSAEKFAAGGYHLHYLCNIPSLTIDETIRFVELKWADSIGVKKRTNNKSRKFKSTAIDYFIKKIMEKTTLYEFGGKF